MAKEQVEFGIRIPDVFKAGFRGYRENFVPLSLGALVTLAAYAVFRIPAQRLYSDGQVWTSIAVDMVGLLISGTLAYPWFAYALKAFRSEPITLAEPLAHPKRFLHQAGASFFFWAGILLGVRYPFLGIPFLSLLILVLYAFYGYVIADTPPDKEGMRGSSFALGTSVRLSEGRRFGLFAIASVFAIFNFFGAVAGIAVGQSLENDLAGYAAAIVGLVVTTSITLVAGAFIYDDLREKLGDHLIPQDARAQRPRKSKGASNKASKKTSKKTSKKKGKKRG